MQRLGRGVLEAHRSWDAQDHCLAGGGRWGQRQKPWSKPSPQPSHVRDCRARAHQERRGASSPSQHPRRPAHLRLCREQGDGGSAGTPGSRCTQQASGHGARVGPSLSHPLGGLCPLPQKSRGDCAWDTWEKQRPTSPRACCDRWPPCRPSGLVHPFLRGLCPRHLADDEGRLREGRGSPESTAPGGRAQVRARPIHNGCPRGVRAGAVDTAAMPRVA